MDEIKEKEYALHFDSRGEVYGTLSLLFAYVIWESQPVSSSDNQ